MRELWFAGLSGDEIVASRRPNCCVLVVFPLLKGFQVVARQEGLQYLLWNDVFAKGNLETDCDACIDHGLDVTNRDMGVGNDIGCVLS
jgi:hypothetical protein